MKLTHASTFSGIGAPEIAAEMLGWQNVFHCEINPFGRAILDYYFPNSTSYEDITKTDFTEWKGKVNVLTGGFPCQPFSYAGKRRGSEDDRYLWPYMLRCIEQVQPDWFIGENVAGITTMVFPSEDVKVGSYADLFGESYNTYERHEPYVLNDICEGLERAGYSVQPILIPACAVGAPHRRDRVWIIAHRDTTDTECSRGGTLHQHLQSKFANGDEFERDGRERTTTDTNGEGREEWSNERDCKNKEEEGTRMDDRTKRTCRNGITADTESESSDRDGSTQREYCESQSSQLGRGSGKDGSYLLPANRWRVDKVTGKGTWNSNPYVFVYEFELLDFLKLHNS